MGYVYMLSVALLFSFGGTCAKLISPYFGPAFITFFRFAVGVCFLLLLKAIRRQPFRKDYRASVKRLAGWILFGAVAKWMAYLAENYGLAHGPSYGNIVTQPAQAIFLTLTSVFLFHEKLSRKKVACIVLCLVGVLCISWNGRSLESFFQENALLMILFIISGICAGSHVLAQKMIADQMDIIDSNLTIFTISGILSGAALLPQVAEGALIGVHPNVGCIFGILMFGFITGIGFYLNAKAIPLLPFYMIPILQSSMVIFAILWGALFFHEAITVYIVAGTLMFLFGIIRLQLLNQRSE